MAVREITYCGEPILRRIARKIHEIDDDLVRLVADMRDTMGPAAGMGLAAPQVGVSLAVTTVWLDTEGEENAALLNPRIVHREGQEESFEGCLSLPTLRGMLTRPTNVVVEAVNLAGEEIVIEAEGILAHCLAHEVDHLRGTLFIDEVEPDTLVWMRPDEREESGFRFDPTTLAEATEAFGRLIESKRQREKS